MGKHTKEFRSFPWVRFIFLVSPLFSWPFERVKIISDAWDFCWGWLVGLCCKAAWSGCNSIAFESKCSLANWAEVSLQEMFIGPWIPTNVTKFLAFLLERKIPKFASKIHKCTLSQVAFFTGSWHFTFTSKFVGSIVAFHSAVSVEASVFWPLRRLSCMASRYEARWDLVTCGIWSLGLWKCNMKAMHFQDVPGLLFSYFMLYSYWVSCYSCFGSCFCSGSSPSSCSTCGVGIHISSSIK